MSLDAKTLEQLRRSRSNILGIITKKLMKINPIDIKSLKSIRTMLQSKHTLVQELSEAVSVKINPDDSMNEEYEIHYDI